MMLFDKGDEYFRQFVFMCQLYAFFDVCRDDGFTHSW